MRGHGWDIEQDLGGQVRESECGCIVVEQRSQQCRHVGVASTDGVHDPDARSRNLEAVLRSGDHAAHLDPGIEPRGVFGAQLHYVDVSGDGLDAAPSVHGLRDRCPG